jgi:hypothetical protein
MGVYDEGAWVQREMTKVHRQYWGELKQEWLEESAWPMMRTCKETICNIHLYIK